jgi:hypothetical protein
MNVFLIDADNLNSGAWVDEAFRVLEASEGAIPVRRAYGSAENLKGLSDVLRSWAVRPFVNLSLTKNTTDIALAVDAMEFACQSPAPQMMIIGSGDADFVPLVVRLRERGIRMVCVSERGKMGREAVSAYDRVVLVGPEQALYEAQQAAGVGLVSAPDAPVSPSPARKKASVAKKPPAKKAVSKVVAAKKATPRASKAKAIAPATNESTANHMTTLDVSAILQAVPALQGGQPQPLAAVAKALLDAKLRGKNMTATKLLKKFPLHFDMLPIEKPTTVTYNPAQEAS